MTFQSMSNKLESLFRQAGWSPDRRIAIDHWEERLAADGITVLPEARELLQSFGGLRVGSMKFDPLCYEIDSIECWQSDEYLGQPLTPIADIDQNQLEAYIAKDGRCFASFGSILYLLGDSFIEAMENRIAVPQRPPVILFRIPLREGFRDEIRRIRDPEQRKD